MHQENERPCSLARRRHRCTKKCNTGTTCTRSRERRAIADLPFLPFGKILKKLKQPRKTYGRVSFLGHGHIHFNDFCVFGLELGHDLIVVSTLIEKRKEDIRMAPAGKRKKVSDGGMLF